MGLKPEQATPEAILTIARQTGIAIDGNVIRAIDQFLKARLEDESLVEAVIARSTPPVHGENGWIEWADGLDPTEEREEVVEDEDENADYYKGREYASVNAGESIGKLHPPTEGVDGKDVLGRVIKAKPGKDLARKLHESLTLGDEGQVEADHEGVLVVMGGLPVITRLLKVRESVDFSTGHIDFSGNVTISGGVRSGFEVKATGDINVQGLIEVSKLECDGDLIARCGMAGKGKGRLIVGGNAKANYLEDARGTIAGDLNVQRGIIGCELVVGGSILSPTATLMGGKIAVSESLKLKVLGSEAGTPTFVALGDVPMLRAERREKTKAARELEFALSSLEDRQKAMPLGVSPSPHDLERAELLSAQIVEIAESLQALRARVEQLDEEIASPRTLDVCIGKIIHPNVTLLIARKRVQFPRAIKGPISICWDSSHQPAYRIGSGPAQPLSNIATVTFTRTTTAA